jgi:hypothetical protein
LPPIFVALVIRSLASYTKAITRTYIIRTHLEKYLTFKYHYLYELSTEANMLHLPIPPDPSTPNEGAFDRAILKIAALAVKSFWITCCFIGPAIFEARVYKDTEFEGILGTRRRKWDEKLFLVKHPAANSPAN